MLDGKNSLFNSTRVSSKRVLRSIDILPTSYSRYSMIEYLTNSVNDLSLQVIDLKKKINNFCLNHNDLTSRVTLSRLEDELFQLEEMRSIRLSRLNSIIDCSEGRLH